MLRNPIVLLAVLLLAATVAVQHWTATTQPLPLPRPLASFPTHLAGWVPPAGSSAALLRKDPRADASLAREYQRDGTILRLSLTYYGRQWDTRRLLAASFIEPEGGWIDAVRSRIDLPVAGAPTAREIHAATLLMRREQQRYALMYWYQLGPQAFSADLRYRASLLANTLFHRRSEGTLVRIAAVVPVDASDPFAAHRAFVRDFYPELLRSVPL